MPRAANDDQPVLAFAFDLGNVERKGQRHLLVAYDEIYSIKLLGQKLRPYWRRNGATAARSLASRRARLPTLARTLRAIRQ